MRKLVLFGLLAAFLAVSLFLEQRLTKGKTIPPSGGSEDTLELLIGTDEPPSPRPANRVVTDEPKPSTPSLPPSPKRKPIDNQRELKASESLEDVCRQVYGSDLYAENLAQVNGLASPAAAKPGMTLTLPPRSDLEKRYRVKRHDTLSDIASRLMGSAKQADRLAEWNHLENKNALREDRVLRIPD